MQLGSKERNFTTTPHGGFPLFLCLRGSVLKPLSFPAPSLGQIHNDFHNRDDHVRTEPLEFGIWWVWAKSKCSARRAMTWRLYYFGSNKTISIPYRTHPFCLSDKNPATVSCRQLNNRATLQQNPCTTWRLLAGSSPLQRLSVCLAKEPGSSCATPSIPACHLPGGLPQVLGDNVLRNIIIVFLRPSQN